MGAKGEDGAEEHQWRLGVAYDPATMEQIHRSQLSDRSRHHPTHVCPPGCATVRRQGKFATNKVSKHPNLAHPYPCSTHHHASQISLFHQVYFTFRQPLPEPEINWRRRRQPEVTATRDLAGRPSALGYRIGTFRGSVCGAMVSPSRTISPTHYPITSTADLRDNSLLSLSRPLSRETLPFRHVSRTGSSRTPLVCLHD